MKLTNFNLDYAYLFSIKPIVLFLLVLFFTGCGPIYYVPNTQNVPIMKDKGQMNLFLGFNGSEFTDGFELQGAYGLTDKWALQLNADWIKSSETFSEGSGNLLEIGGGYYKKISKSFVFETYGFIGFGGLKYQDNSTDNLDVTAKLYRVGLQPSFSYSGKYFSSSLSSRLSSLHYTNVNGSLLYDVDYLKSNDSHWLLEPALTLQGGFEDVKLQLQIQLCYNLTNPMFSQDYTLVSLGLKVNIDPKKK
jgi:hypothetical protein